MLERILDAVEHASALDRLTKAADAALRPALRQPRVSRLLSGAWLGHRVHPMLTDAVIGTWMSASIIDALGGPESRRAARRLVGVGLVSAVPTVLTGAHDWLDYGRKVRRVGLVHALANKVALLLQLASWRARGRGDHRRGAALSLGAMAAGGLGAYVGGHLSLVLGAGVERTAFQEAPGDWTPTVPYEQLQRDRRAAFDADGTGILLVLEADRVHALADTCNHAGCSLAEGAVADGAVTCPCHGSRFRLTDGKTLAGPAAAGQPTFETRVRGGVVEVRERQPSRGGAT